MKRITRLVQIPELVRVKPGALDRLGIYLSRYGVKQVATLHSHGLPDYILTRADNALTQQAIQKAGSIAVASNSDMEVERIVTALPQSVECVLGIGGGKALDVAKLVAARLQKTLFVVPTSLSNDGFASPQSSLVVDGRRQSVAATIPGGVVVDTEVCLAAPRILWCSGVGDLVAKLTAVRDWKLAFHHDGTPVDDFAALLSDASVFQFMGRSQRDLEGVRLLATALMLNGIAMGICGSSRPASGSEHLISHALDEGSAKPRLHGLQVGVATYLVSHLHGSWTQQIRELFDETGFWAAISDDPFSRREWKAAIERAPEIKSDFHTVLSEPGQAEKLVELTGTDPVLRQCFIDDT